MTDLLPCPFCGTEPMIESSHLEHFSCENPECLVVSVPSKVSFKQATEMWNRRAQHSLHVVGLKKAVDAALYARIPGGSEAWVWIMPQDDAHAPTQHQREIVTEIVKAAFDDQGIDYA